MDTENKQQRSWCDRIYGAFSPAACIAALILAGQEVFMLSSQGVYIPGLLFIFGASIVGSIIFLCSEITK